MSFSKSISILFVTLLLAPGAFARKPAVEDFVGVEPESYVAPSQGTEVLFDFGNTVQAITTENTSQWGQWMPVFVLISFMLLPMVVWFGITRTENKNNEQTQEPAHQNVARLSDYQKEREQEEEQIKKAS